MMSDVGENDQPENLPDNTPAQPPAPQPGPQPDWDPERVRQFQEFLRFQQFQEFSRQQEQQRQPPADPPTPPAGNQVVPAGQPDIHQQLATVQQQLARIERVTNPPVWKKVLRSHTLRWVAGLVVIVALAIWGIPALINHYFSPTGNPAAYTQITSGHPIPLGNDTPVDSVSAVYTGIANNNSRNTCPEYFSPSGQSDLAAAYHVKTCGQAIAVLARQVTDKDAYAYPRMQPMAQEPDRGRPVTISGCTIDASGGPQLGDFTLTYHPDHLGWLISGYTAPTTCPSTAPTTTGGF